MKTALPSTLRPARHSLRLAPLCLALAIASGCGNSSPEAALASAKQYLDKHDLPAATIELKNALAAQSNLTEARFLLGRTLLDSGEPVTAEIELRKALEQQFPLPRLAPSLARALLAQGKLDKLLEELGTVAAETATDRANLKTTLGTALALQSKLDAARQSFEAALAEQSGYAPARLGLARLRIVARDLPGATAMVDDIVAAAPDDADAWQLKADLLRAAEQTDAALAAYQKTISLKPTALNAHAAAIMIHLRGQKNDLAQTQLAALQKVAAKHPLTLYMQGLVAYGRKDLPSVQSAMEALLKMQPDNPQGLQLAGIVAFESRADLQAQEYLGKALQKAPGLDYGRRVLVLSQLRSGQPAKALATLQPVLQGTETAPLWLALAGEVHVQNGDLAGAEAFFKRSSKADPQNRKTQTALALTRLQMGRVDQAFADLEQIAAADSHIGADMAMISWAMQRKQFDKALQAIAQLEKKQPDNPAAAHLRGMALLGKGDAATASRQFARALEINPAYLPAASSLAQLDLAAKHPDQARQRFADVLKKDPKNVQAMLALAKLRASGGGSPDEITQLIAQAIAAAPDDATPRIALIGHHLSVKDQPKALTALQEALAALPNRAEILDVAGRVYQLTGDTQQALSTYGKLATLLPSAVQPLLRMAEVHANAGDKSAARASIERGLAVQPDSLQLQRALIMLDVDAQQFDAALTKARDMQKAHPDAAVGYLLEGDVQAIRKDWPLAAKAYASGLKIQPSTDLAQRQYAALTQAERPGEARAMANEWLKAHAKDHTFRLFLADLANRRKDFDGAIAHYRQLLADQPEHPALLNNLAWSLGQKGDPQAIVTAEKALKLAPNHPMIMDTLGSLLAQTGKDVPRGLELLAKAVALLPKAADIRFNYAKALLQAKQPAAAKQELEILAKLGDKHPLYNEVEALRKGL